MRVLDRYTLTSIISTAVVTLALCTLMLLSVDLFTNLDSYLTVSVGLRMIVTLTLLGIPEAIVFALGPSLLFAVAYHLSTLEANNEMIAISGAGISYRRIVLPILILALLCSVGQLALSEFIRIPMNAKRQHLEDSIFGLRSTYDSRNLTIRDPGGRYVVSAKYYNDSTQTLSQVVLVPLTQAGSVAARIDADRAVWEEGVWRLEGTRSQTVEGGSTGITIEERQTMVDAVFDLEPSYFRSSALDMTTMELTHALRYVREIAVIDSQRYPPLATDLVKRLFDALNPLILVFIAVTISYHYKKSVLLFSIITSLILAVIYYVVQMVTLIMARQGVIGPVWGMVIPVFVLVSIALLERAIIRGRA